MLSTGCQILSPVNAPPADRDCDDMVWPSANPAGLARWLRVGTTLNGGNAIDWALRVFADDVAQVPNVAHDIRSNGDVFISWLDGMGAPISRPDVSEGFIGPLSHHGADELIQAVIDGVTLGIADVYQRMFGSLDAELPLRVGGGGVRNRRWLESIAHIFDRPLAVADEPDLSAWGAARSAASTLGWFDPVAEPSLWMPHFERIAPERRHVDAARSRFESFRRSASGAADLSLDVPE